MYQYVFAAILAIAVPVRFASAQTGQLDASPTLFTVMAAINLCGYDADLNSAHSHPLRKAIREELAKRDIPSLPALKEFVARHRRPNDTDELSQYISFALTVGPPPKFEINKRDVDIPPDVSGLKDFSDLLASFYREANIADLWKRSQGAIEQEIGFYHQGVSDAVLQSNVYLRQPTSGFQGRHFQIFLELQGAPNQIHTRSYGNEYTIVITVPRLDVNPRPSPKIFEVRHAYLTYLLDALATRNQEILARKQSLIEQAKRARTLPEIYQNDFLLLTTASLVKAVEARLDKQSQGVEKALLDGYILTPFFAEQLQAYEKQDQSMLLYYKEMVSAIDLRVENARLARLSFNVPAPPPPVNREPVNAEPVLTGAAKTLDDAEKLYQANDLEGAKKLFLSVIQETDLRPMHASAYYGLGRIAVRQNDPETGERLLGKALDLEPEPWVRAWTLVYLGRLAQAAGEKAEALQRFQGALQVEGASTEARKQAQLGIQQNSK